MDFQLAIFWLVVILCGASAGVGLCRVMAYLYESRSRRNWSRVLTAKAGRA